MLVNRSGQVMLLSVFIAIILALCVATIVMLNRTGGRHQIAAQTRIKGINISRQGIAYAETILGKDAVTWKNALLGGFPAECRPESPPIQGPGGTSFKLTCSIDTTKYPTLQKYEVAVTAKSMASIGSESAGPRGLLAFLSQATLAVSMPNGQGVSAALQLMNTPVPGHIVKLVHHDPVTLQDMDVLNGSVMVPQLGSDGNFNYAALPNPVTLKSGDIYYLVSHEAWNGDFWWDDDTRVNSGSAGTVLSSVYWDDNAPAPAWTLHRAGRFSYVPVDFQYQGSGGGTNNFLNSRIHGGGANRNNFTGWVGCELQVGASDLVVTSLGHINVTGNGNAYVVEWGPIADYDPITPPTVWDMPDNSNLGTVGLLLPPPKPFSLDINAARFPRKFSVGGITGEPSTDPNLFRDPCCSSGTPNNSDQAEYWAFTSLGFPPAINLNAVAPSYYTLAAAETGDFTDAFSPSSAQNPGTLIHADPTKCFIPGDTTCGYFTVPLLNPQPPGCLTCIDTAVFSGASPGYQAPKKTEVIYVDGNAEFDDMDLILKQNASQGGAVIVTGNLTLGKKYPYFGGTTSGGPLVYHQPPTWQAEYAHGTGSPPGPPSFPPVKASFQGFLYVQGDLIVNNFNDTPPTDLDLKHNWWIMAGAIRVDGHLILDTYHNLFVVYDDEINHQILTNPVVLQVDSLQEIGQ